MKNRYLLALIAVLFVITSANSQSWNPDVISSKRAKTNEPILGLGVNIPLNKLFSKKKVKPLPQQPDFIQEAPDTSVAADDLNEPAPVLIETYSVPVGDGGIPVVVDTLANGQGASGNVNQTNTCIAWILTTYYSDGTFDERLIGVSCVSDSPTVWEDGIASGGGGDADEECKRCKRLARAKMAIANEKLNLARQIWANTRQEIENRPWSDWLASFGVAGGVVATVNGAGSLSLISLPSAAVLEAIALFSGGLAGYATYKQLRLKAETDAMNGYLTYQSALLDWESAQLDFENSLRECGSCL